MLRLTLCYCSDSYILVSTTTMVPNTAAAGAVANNILIKNYAPFTYCISEINNTQIGNAKNINVDV